MDKINDIDMGRLMQKVEDAIKLLNDKCVELENIKKDIATIKTIHEVTACSYAKKLGEEVAEIKDWKTGLAAKIYIITGIIVFAAGILSIVLGQYLIHIFGWGG